MYCPRCSREQTSEQTKFCSKCGFPLALVSEILAHDGASPPQFTEVAAHEGNRCDTNDLTQPGSVTENTTKLLEKDA